MQPHVDAGSAGAFGYLWWVARDGVLFPGTVVPEGTYAALGYGGQALVVVSRYDLVIVHRVEPIPEHTEAMEHLGAFIDRVLRARQSD